MNAASGEWWLRENRIEAVVCLLPTLEDIMEGVHVVEALGHDGMVFYIAVNTEQAERDPDNATTVQLIYLARLLRDGRLGEARAA